MTARFVRPVSAAASWSRRLGVFAFVLFGVAAGVHRAGALPLPDFLPAIAIAGLLAAIALLLAAIGLQRLWRIGAEGGWASLLGLALGCAVLLPLGYAGWLALNTPRLYEVTTDPDNPPAWIIPPGGDAKWMARAPITDSMRLLQVAAYPEIVSHRYDGGIDRVLAAVRRASADLHLHVVATSGMPQPAPMADLPHAVVVPTAPHRPAGPIPVPLARPLPPDTPTPLVPPGAPPPPARVTIQATHRSPVLGLNSDVLIRLDEDAQTTVVDLRVAARYGDRDLGIGAHLIDAFYGALDDELQDADN